MIKKIKNIFNKKEQKKVESFLAGLEKTKKERASRKDKITITLQDMEDFENL
jgi:hypothetical protein